MILRRKKPIGCVVAWIAFLPLQVVSAHIRQNPYDWIDQFAHVLVKVEQLHVNPVDRNQLLKGAVKGLVQELDPHSTYLSKEEYAAFRARLKGKFACIGVEVKRREGDIYQITELIEKSPAARAGLQAGDVITHLYGIPVEELPLAQFYQHMQGTPGTSLQLTVHRKGTSTPLVFSVIREELQFPSLTSRFLETSIALLRIRQFQENTHREFLDHLHQLLALHSIEGVILDVRNNPGGSVDQAIAIIDEFVDNGTILSTHHRGKVESIQAKKGGALLHQPTAILVDEGTASAAELLAASLQDLKRAWVIGGITFGKTNIQTVIDLPEQAGLCLTTGFYTTASGQSLQAKGVKPDILIESSRVLVTHPSFSREKDLKGHLTMRDQEQEKQEQSLLTSSPATQEEADFSLQIARQLIRSMLRCIGAPG
ncbi:S41 family peptidase [Pajaroellobacter abortibovis]|uniref:PDZ domain-containing protein n=1 Tax=Pajaroellobacter abortibovis TaxID=1882918 RepID=A0A1L6MVI3_9BACT|nr:S41 family peptidase [Pajaroellobacter abortibovis]APR99553.1 hypothetical protein BCY86_01800 [Pajaroellobacter abortibovis]